MKGVKMAFDQRVAYKLFRISQNGGPDEVRSDH